MRLHHLELTAFGPFAGTVSVDFDQLSAANVFLLCGETGSGKTTVLDGVCFALYGDVPSGRGAAKQLRSQHAAKGVAPRVVLDLTLGSRRFRFTRSPAWQRPKKRGHGFTTEQARVLVEELVDDAWVLRSNRIDEAGHLVGEVVGMTLPQFSQVVLLPQGQFDTFLRSSSEDRQKVLTRLFQTDRFERVEQWFAERRRELTRTNKAHDAAVSAVLHRLSETAGCAIPDTWDDDLSGVVADGTVRAWVDALLVSARERRDHALAELEVADQRRQARAAELTAARTLAERQQRHAAAQEEQRGLGATAAGARDERDRLGTARRAALVAPARALAEEATTQRELAARRARSAVGAVAEALDTRPELLDEDDLATREEDTATRLAAARAFVPRAEELQRIADTRRKTEEQIDVLVRQLEDDAARRRTVPERRDALVAELAGLRTRAATLATHEAEAVRLDERLRAAQSVVALTTEVQEARQLVDQQAAAAQELREQWLTLRERRLEGMAAELAAAMAVGQDCPVCGSVEHPSPARPADGAPSRTDEEAARKAHEDQQLALEAHRDQLRGLEARLAAAAELADGSAPQDLAVRLESTREQARQARAADERLEPLERDLAGLDAELAELDRRVAGRTSEVSACRERAEELAETERNLSEQLAGILGPDGARLEDVIAAHQRLRGLLTAAREALAEHARCTHHAAQADQRLRQAAAEAGFDDPAAAARAHLTEAELAELERRVRDRERREHEVAGVLADPELRAAATAARPDLDRLTAAHQEADRTHSAAAGATRLAEQALARLEQRSRELDEALAAWGPAREEHARVRALAELVEGKGADNTRQMRLSAYVLASRLGQVVAAANVRLVGMVDGRYVLEHADRAAGDRRGGLSLRVRDLWTDECRDPVTLSGGETFVVSLALALGLADVVTAESGGTRIDTLFVDEGFGSLDAETLEQVMDSLDQLREGGRVVGVVSHVAEMKARIPSRLQVIKGRSGSHLRQQVAG